MKIKELFLAQTSLQTLQSAILDPNLGLTISRIISKLKIHTKELGEAKDEAIKQLNQFKEDLYISKGAIASQIDNGISYSFEGKDKDKNLSEALKIIAEEESKLESQLEIIGKEEVSYDSQAIRISRKELGSAKFRENHTFDFNLLSNFEQFINFED